MFANYIIESILNSDVLKMSANDLNDHIQKKINNKNLFSTNDIDSILKNPNLSSDHLLSLSQNLDLVSSKNSHQNIFVKVMSSEKNPEILNKHVYSFLQSPHLGLDQHLKLMTKGIRTGNPSMPVDNKLKERILMAADNTKNISNALNDEDKKAREHTYQPPQNKYLLNQNLK